MVTTASFQAVNVPKIGWLGYRTAFPLHPEALRWQAATVSLQSFKLIVKISTGANKEPLK